MTDHDTPTREQVQKALESWDYMEKVFDAVRDVPGTGLFAVLAAAAQWALPHLPTRCDRAWPASDTGEMVANPNIEPHPNHCKCDGDGVVLPEPPTDWQYCPVCGEHKDKCSPLRCGAWKTVAKFNHETRKWVPVVDEAMIERGVKDHAAGPPLYELSASMDEVLKHLPELADHIVEVRGEYIVKRVLEAALENQNE